MVYVVTGRISFPPSEDLVSGTQLGCVLHSSPEGIYPQPESRGNQIDPRSFIPIPDLLYKLFYHLRGLTNVISDDNNETLPTADQMQYRNICVLWYHRRVIIILLYDGSVNLHDDQRKCEVLSTLLYF